MAWECSGATNSHLIENLVKTKIIRSDAVAQAMRQVDRAKYVTRADISSGTADFSSQAYQDSPQYIGLGATISAPHMHAMCCELLLPSLTAEDSRILDVGSGSGYLTAVLARLAGPKAAVYGIEHIPQLVNVSIRNINNDDPALASQIHISQGDGRAGIPSAAPFNAIHVGAASPTIPQALIDQLAPGGRMVIPVGPAGGLQYLELVTKSLSGSVSTSHVTGVSYVPLTSLEDQLSRA